jgi:hypothetical protein
MCGGQLFAALVRHHHLDRTSHSAMPVGDRWLNAPSTNRGQREPVKPRRKAASQQRAASTGPRVPRPESLIEQPPNVRTISPELHPRP